MSTSRPAISISTPHRDPGIEIGIDKHAHAFPTYIEDDLASAKSWLRNIFDGASKGVMDIYRKGQSQFNDMFFVIFASTDLRTSATQSSNSLKSKCADKASFMNPDLPVQGRVKNSYLKGL